MKIGGTIITLYFLIHHTTGTIIGILIGSMGYKMYMAEKKKKVFTENPVEKPPYPKLHKPDSTTIHFPKNN